VMIITPSRRWHQPNLTLEKPMLPPQPRDMVIREIQQSCTPQPQPRPSPQSNRGGQEEEEEKDFDMPPASERNDTPIPASAIKRLALQSNPTTNSSSQSYLSPPASNSTLKRSATSTLRNRIETLDLSISPPPAPSSTTTASSSSSSSPTPLSRPSPSLSHRSKPSKDSTLPSQSRSNHLKPVSSFFLSSLFAH